jgi:Zn-dependent protease
MGSLRFGAFGFPVQVQPAFLWLVAIVFLSDLEEGWGKKLLLIITLFSSVLVHELGHAFVARGAGQSPSIIIHAFGGLTTWIPESPISRGRAILISLAGPGAGLGLAVVGFVLTRWIPPSILGAGSQITLGDFLVMVVWVNGFWSLVNLLPVLPFDGGQVLGLLLGPRRRLLVATISMVVGVGAGIWLFWLGLPIAAVMFGASGILQYLTIRRSEVSPPPAVEDLNQLLHEAREALDHGQAEKALELARKVADASHSMVQRRAAYELLAWAAIAKNDRAEARHALRWLLPGAVDPLLQAAVLEAEGDLERAVQCLRQARNAGDERVQLAASLVRILLGVGRFGEAAQLTLEILEHVEPEEARQVAASAVTEGRHAPAAALYEHLFRKTHDTSDLLAAARARALAQDSGLALSHLEEARALGLDLHPLVSDQDFQSLRDEPRFLDVVAGENVAAKSN